MRDDITVIDELLYKDNRLIVPTTLREEFMSLAHQSHGGICACLRRMRESVYWPGMTTQMKQKVKNCEICMKYQENKVIKDPLMSHDTGTTPWSKIEVDICYFDNRTLLVTSDYYSNYITVRRLRNQGTDDVINELLGIFSTHGLPENIVCDNGPQFREKFLKFTKDHDINLVTSSPYLPQSNGKAENAVKTIKRIFKKCRDNKISEQLAILNYNNTPTEGIELSLSQRLFGRRCRTLLPLTEEILKARHKTDEEREKQSKTKIKQAYYYNTELNPSPIYKEGDVVHIKKPREEFWTKGKCLKEVKPRSFEIEIKDKVYRRNSRDIRMETQSEVEPTTDIITKEVAEAPSSMEPLRRSSRMKKKPSRFLCEM